MAFVFAAVILACEREDSQEQTGYLYVDLKRDFTVDPVFKSDQGQDMVFSLVIYNWKDQVVAVYDDYRDLAAEPLELRTGPYRVVASSASSGAAAFDAPFYSGEEDVVIRGNSVTSATITASLANVKVTASFSDEIKELFSEYTLTVSNGDGTLVFSNLDDSTDREGYFSATGLLTWTLSLKNVDGSVYEDITETYTDVKPRQYYNLQFTLGEMSEFGGTSVEVQLDGATKDKSYNLLLDFEYDVRPTVSSNGFDMFQTTLFAEGEQSADRVDVVLLVQVINGSRALDTFVDTGGEDETVHTLQMGADLVIRHLEIVAVFDLHLGRQYRAGRERRKGDGRHFVSAGDEFFGCLRTEQAGSADHKYFHLKNLLEFVLYF